MCLTGLELPAGSKTKENTLQYGIARGDAVKSTRSKSKCLQVMAIIKINEVRAETINKIKYNTKY